MILYGLVQECMGLMRILNEVLCGKNSQGCTPGGIQHGVFLGISIPFDIRVRDLVVRLLVRQCLLFQTSLGLRLLVRQCLLFQTSLGLITLWTYPLGFVYLV